MLVDLRDRIQSQASLPSLPPDWYAEAELRSAGGSSFAGDFLVASRSRDGRLLQVAVVDVSGKGEQAGSRSLLLSGAFAGLLHALKASDFLTAANDYLLRQDWSEGFATAVHLCIDLSTGEFEIRSAGHPPAVQLQAGSGRWVVHEVEGPILGLMGDAEFAVTRGVLQRGDAMLMFKAVGVEPVSNSSRDVGKGIARWDAYLHVADPDALAAEFASRNVALSQPLADTDDGLRGFEIRDVNGYVLFFGRPLT